MIVMQPENTFDSLKGSEVEPCLAFHNGIPSGSITSAYDPIQKILALSTRYVSFVPPLIITFFFLLNSCLSSYPFTSYFQLV